MTKERQEIDRSAERVDCVCLGAESIKVILDTVGRLEREAGERKGEESYRSLMFRERKERNARAMDKVQNKLKNEAFKHAKEGRGDIEKVLRDLLEWCRQLDT